MHFLMRLLYITVISICSLSILSACGNKGPLYLPDNETRPIIMEPTTPPAAVITGTEE